MNFRSYILFLFLAIGWTQAGAQDFRKTAPEPGPAPKIEIGDYETFKLDNGLMGIVVENHKLPRVSFQLSLDLPPLIEGDKAGTADMAGDLLSAGTKTRKKAEIDEAVDFIGATLSTSAGGAFGASLTKHKDKLMEVLADVVLNPAFPEEEFEKLKKQTLSNLAINKSEPDAIAGNVTRVMRYGSEHPYGELTTEETVNNITLEDAKAFYQTYFRPDGAYFVVVGDISVKEAEQLAKKYFKDWKGPKAEEKTYPMPERPTSTQVDFVDKAGAVQSVISITHPLSLTLGDPLAIPGSVMNTILGDGFSGRLFQNLREDKAYTYGAYSQVSPDKHVGNFNAGASVRNEVTDSAIVEFMAELERIRTEPVSDVELQRAKNIRAGSFARNLEQPQTVARFALNTVRYDLSEDFYATYLEKLSKVTKEDVMKAAQEFIRPDQAHIVVVGNKGEVAEKLARFDLEDGAVNYYDVYGREIKMDDSAVPEDLTAEEVIENYISAIGGREKLESLEDLTMTMGASLQGQNLESVVKRKAPNLMSMQMNMSGMSVMTQKFDGEKGEALQMGNPIPLDEAAQTEMKNQAILFPETQLKELGYQMELKGLEMVEGKKAYAVEMTSPAGTKTTDYYDISNGLKIRSVSGANGSNVVSDFEDYREVEGVKFPFKTTVSGMMPIPLTMEVKSIEVNTGLADAEFEVK